MLTPTFAISTLLIQTYAVAQVSNCANIIVSPLEADSSGYTTVAVVPSLWLMMEFYARMGADKVCSRLMWYSCVSGWEDECEKG